MIFPPFLFSKNVDDEKFAAEKNIKSWSSQSVSLCVQSMDR